MSTKSYEVAAPLVVIKDGEGRDRYLYKGATVPTDVDTEHRDQLVDEGLLVEAKAPTTTSTDSTTTSTSTTSGSDTPNRSATKAAWVEYATAEARGDDRLTEEEANAFTRDQLAEKYLGTGE